jgi:hypothetical protein
MISLYKICVKAKQATVRTAYKVVFVLFEAVVVLKELAFQSTYWLEFVFKQFAQGEISHAVCIQ